MRRVILQNFVTLDGFAAGPNGETDFIVANRSLDEDFKRSAGNIDTILLGHETYSIFSQYWPTVTTETELIADFVNATSKLVFGGRWTGHPGATRGRQGSSAVTPLPRSPTLKRRPVKI